MISITKKTASKKPTEPYIASFLKINPKKVNQKRNLKTSQQIKTYLECITDRKIARMLYALSLVRISTSTKLSEYLEVKSRDTIVYYSLKAVNAGLMEIKLTKDPDYDIYWDYWFGIVRNTHKDTRFYVATEELLNVIPLYQEFMDSLIDENAKSRLQAAGNVFERFLEKGKSEKQDKEKEVEKIAMMTIGACTKCSKLLTIEHKKLKECEYIGKDLYCKACKSQMFSDGTMDKILKDHNGKNGRH